jgi:hypothetical protein
MGNPVKWLILSFWVVAAASAQNIVVIVVDTAPSHVANTFSPALVPGATSPIQIDCGGGRPGHPLCTSRGVD